VTAVSKFFSCYEKYQHKEPLKDLGIPGMTVEEFWKDGDKDHNEFEYGKIIMNLSMESRLLQNKPIKNCRGP
jgi:hypothetical protein